MNDRCEICRTHHAARDYKPKVGDRVTIEDCSEAQGDKGTILYIQSNGVILVELDAGCVWPLVGCTELEPITEEQSCK